ncbi:MAG: polysaccharide deacetylase family protein [Woeseia sp.]
MSVADSLRRTALGLLSPAGSRGRLMILSFHQVPRDADEMAPGTPPAAVFEQQMRWVADYCNVLPLPEAAARLGEGTLPARAACITFDDGYADNVEVAAPVLQRLGLSATFFITAGAVEEGIMWNDLVIEGVRRANGVLDLGDLGLGIHELADDAARRAAVPAVIDQLKYRQLTPRLNTAQEIFSRATGEAPPRMMMSKAQVAELAEQGFDVGAHTINHPILKELTADEARREIEESRDWVRNVTGEMPRSFAYPNGRPGIDFEPEHEDMVEEAGFSVAVSTQWACAKKSDPAFALPRFTPWERERGAFWQRLAKTAIQSYTGGG